MISSFAPWSRGIVVPSLIVVIVATTAVIAENVSLADGVVVAARAIDGIVVSSSEMAVISATNAARARQGLPLLAIDASLMAAARGHAARMASSGSLVHTSANVAENIAMGQPSGSEAVSSWMQSSGHRQNLLDRRHSQIGVAVAYSASGTPFWCQQFR